VRRVPSKNLQYVTISIPFGEQFLPAYILRILPFLLAKRDLFSTQSPLSFGIAYAVNVDSVVGHFVAPIAGKRGNHLPLPYLGQCRPSTVFYGSLTIFAFLDLLRNIVLF